MAIIRVCVTICSIERFSKFAILTSSGSTLRDRTDLPWDLYGRIDLESNSYAVLIARLLWHNVRVFSIPRHHRPRKPIKLISHECYGSTA